MSQNKPQTAEVDYSPRELEAAIQLQYAFYIERFPQNQTAKIGDDFLEHMREDTKSNPKLRKQILDEYRQARKQGVYLSDQYGLIHDISKSKLWVTDGVVNLQSLTPDEEKALRQQKTRQGRG